MIFFFSSRRRHTRCLSDWSSDVCSSDLAGVGKNLPLVVNLEVVHVGPIGMDVGADGMSGAMNKIIAVARLLDESAGGAIHFPSGDAASAVDRVENGRHPGVARVAHNLENFLHLSRGRAAHKTHPRYVVEIGRAHV